MYMSRRFFRPSTKPLFSTCIEERDTAIMPYPTRYITSWKLPDGVEVFLRPIRPEDEPLMRELAIFVSHETIRTRLFSSIKDMSHE
jgi:acetyltransferase